MEEERCERAQLIGGERFAHVPHREMTLRSCGTHPVPRAPRLPPQHWASRPRRIVRRATQYTHEPGGAVSHQYDMQGARRSSMASTMGPHGLHLASESERGILARRRRLLRHNLRKQLEVIKADADAYEKGRSTMRALDTCH